jgi:sugar phosphate isomerase/epimerase
MDIFSLLDKVAELGLEGVHLDAAAIGPMDRQHLQKVRCAVVDKGLYIEFNWGLPKAGADNRLQFDLKAGIEITRQLGADLGKVSLNLTRTRPVMASKNSSEVMAQLEQIAGLITEALPLLEHHEIKLAVENHTDCYASEILWLLDSVDHPLVGACIDTVNPLMVGEDLWQAIRELAPRAFTNHFRDSAIHQTRYGCRIVGCALGDGDLDLISAYELIKKAPGVNRINIEIALDAPIHYMPEALDLEYQAISKSINYCRNQLKIR